MKSLAEHLGVIDPRAKPTADAPLQVVEPDILDLTGIEFCQGIVDSREYRESILRRVLLDELAPAVECRLLDMAWGKAPQRLEHTGKDGQPIEITRVERVIIDTFESTSTDKTTTH